jgi:DNA-binding transcriptional ArsR family regulator
MSASSKKNGTGLLLTALGHPLRRRILRAMDGEATSPGKLSERIDEPLSTVSYHVRVLNRCGALHQVRKQPVRGAVEHFYRTAIEAEWARDALNESRQEDGDGAHPPSS